jgi:nicotinate phosphoribosyltransferase
MASWFKHLRRNNMIGCFTRSFLDQDMYKYTMGQMVFNQFPEAIVTYEFKNRGGTQFPPGSVDLIRQEIQAMADLSMTIDEFKFMKGIRFMKPTYLEWLRGYRYDPNDVVVNYDESTRSISMRIHGPWYRTIYWEVPLMALVSEVFFRDKVMKMAPDWKERIVRKAERLSAEGMSWIDFGTRRRAAYMVQAEVVRTMKDYKGFRGTSNVHLAHINGVKPQGTIAHEAHMAMQAKYGVRMSNEMTLEHWTREFGGDLGIMLPDTLTTPVFMKSLSRRDAKLYDGARQDSDDLAKHAQEYIDRLIELDVDPASKVLVPSDSLKVSSAIDFHRKFVGVVKGITAGIGTHFTNDCWVEPSKLPDGEEPIHPLNMVIKMTDADFGYGPIDVVKLSDTPGKNTGNQDRVRHVKTELGI